MDKIVKESEHVDLPLGRSHTVGGYIAIGLLLALIVLAVWFDFREY